MSQLPILGIVFLAVFTESLTGFGSALVSMVLLTQLLGVQLAAPLVALVAGAIEVVLVAWYRRALNLRTVWQLSVAAIISTPLGVIALRHLTEKVALALLGAIIFGYALCAVLNLKLPRLEHPAWAYGFGFLAGLLGGAYNTSGPPVAVYGNCRGWAPAEFKSNLQGFFVINSALVVVSHAASGNITQAVWQNFLVALPAMGLGLAAGLSLDRFLNPETFRRIVLLLLIVVGVRLMLT